MRPLPRLLAFTDGSVRTSHHLGASAAAIASLGPAVALVARDPAASASDLSTFTVRLLAIAHPAEAAVIVSARPDIAASLGADGVQLRAGDLAPGDARQVLPTGWIGRSVHTASEAVDAVAAGADYLVAGNIWQTPTHPDRPGIGLGLIETLASLGRPVIAIGGITADRAREVHAAGGYGIAAIRALWSARDPAAAAAALLEAWTTSTEY